MALFFAVTFPNGVLFKTGVDLQLFAVDGNIHGVDVIKAIHHLCLQSDKRSQDGLRVVGEFHLTHDVKPAFAFADEFTLTLALEQGQKF